MLLSLVAGTAGATAAVHPATMYHVDHIAIIPNFCAQQVKTIHTASFKCGETWWYKTNTSACSRMSAVWDTRVNVDVVGCDCSLFHPHVSLIWFEVHDHARRLKVFPRGVGNVTGFFAFAPAYVGIFLESLGFGSKHVDCTMRVKNLRGANMDVSNRTCRSTHKLAGVSQSPTLNHMSFRNIYYNRLLADILGIAVCGCGLGSIHGFLFFFFFFLILIFDHPFPHLHHPHPHLHAFVRVRVRMQVSPM
jgi:hypothetical protein